MPNKIVNIISEEPFIGEDGYKYVKITKEILQPRKTFVKGTIKGKYRGHRISKENERTHFFDFEIYEAEVHCKSIDDFRKNIPFVFPNDFPNASNLNRSKGTVFPKEKLPTTLPVIVSANDKTFGANILEPQLFDYRINRKEHQVDGEDVFGTFTAYITGYVLDYERTVVDEIVGPIIIPPPPPPPPPSHDCESNGVKTGKSEQKKGYIRYEYYCKHHPDTVWGPWEKIKGGDEGGCLVELFRILGILLLISFLIAILPGLLYFFGFAIIYLLIGLLWPYLKWVFRIIGFLLFLAFLGALVRNCSKVNLNHPLPVLDLPRETRSDITPVYQNDTVVKDYWIKRYRTWSDYEGNQYQGYYKLLKSDLIKSSNYKNQLSVGSGSSTDYDRIVYNLKRYDDGKFNKVYPLFDSISKFKKLNRIQFAELIVSFVQDIPYVLVLEDDCNPNLYDDSFTRRYLSSPDAKCDGYQKFGINSPVEFLANLKGDCDTRTLLLYTILSHYQYDVAIMSSEYYGHSILGINLPISGLAYTYNEQRYVLWETTIKGRKPGQIPEEISNLNNWRISLKSK